MSYIIKKIDHMKRTSLIIGKHNGFGQNGGACPTWLKRQQDEEAKLLQQTSRRRVRSNVPHFEPVD